MSKPRHLFIAFLGTNPYAETRYAVDGELQGTTRFVQVALARHIRNTTDAPLEVRIFCTDKAERDNWDPEPPARYKGLKSALEGEGFTARAVPIPKGQSEDQHWEIFNAILREVERGDHVYVDVTHGFRSHPVLLTKALDYLVQAKQITVERLDYGVYEEDSAESQVVDLRPFLIIDEWARAVGHFRQRGDMLALADTLQTQVRALKKVHKEDFDAALYELPNQTNVLAEALEFCRLHDIAGAAWTLRQTLTDAASAVSEHQSLSPLRPLLDQLHDTIKPMGALPDADPERIRAQVAAVRFLFKHARYLNQKDRRSRGIGLCEREWITPLACARDEVLDGSAGPEKQVGHGVSPPRGRSWATGSDSTAPAR